jgi:hypothetical protein
MVLPVRIDVRLRGRALALLALRRARHQLGLPAVAREHLVAVLVGDELAVAADRRGPALVEEARRCRGAIAHVDVALDRQLRVLGEARHLGEGDPGAVGVQRRTRVGQRSEHVGLRPALPDVHALDRRAVGVGHEHVLALVEVAVDERVRAGEERDSLAVGGDLRATRGEVSALTRRQVADEPGPGGGTVADDDVDVLVAVAVLLYERVGRGEGDDRPVR